MAYVTISQTLFLFLRVRKFSQITTQSISIVSVPTMKFFKRNKKNVGVAGNANMSISSSDSVPATIPSGDSNVKIGSRGSIASSTNSLSGSSYSSYLYPHIKEKNLKDIFKAVWTENFIQTKNILAKSKNKAANAVDNENR